MNQRLPKSREFLDCLLLNLPRKILYSEVILMSFIDQFTVKEGAKTQREIIRVGVLYITARPGRFTSEKDPLPILKEAERAPATVWTGAENFAPTGIRSPDRPTTPSRPRT